MGTTGKAIGPLVPTRNWVQRYSNPVARSDTELGPTLQQPSRSADAEWGATRRQSGGSEWGVTRQQPSRSSHAESGATRQQYARSSHAESGATRQQTSRSADAESGASRKQPSRSAGAESGTTRKQLCAANRRWRSWTSMRPGQQTACGSEAIIVSSGATGRRLSRRSRLRLWLRCRRLRRCERLRTTRLSSQIRLRRPDSKS